MSEQLKFCLSIIKDLLHKKNFVWKTICSISFQNFFVPSLGNCLAICQTCRCGKSQSTWLSSDHQKTYGSRNSESKRMTNTSLWIFIYRFLKKKLENREYATPDEVATDVRLVFSNCYLYNRPETDVVSMCKKVEVIFPDHWSRNRHFYFDWFSLAIVRK